MTFRDKMWREPLLVGATLFFNVFLYTKTFYACVEILHMQHPNKFFLAPVLLTKFIEFIQYESCSSLGRIKISNVSGAPTLKLLPKLDFLSSHSITLKVYFTLQVIPNTLHAESAVQRVLQSLYKRLSSFHCVFD